MFPLQTQNFKQTRVNFRIVNKHIPKKNTNIHTLLKPQKNIKTDVPNWEIFFIDSICFDSQFP